MCGGVQKGRPQLESLRYTALLFGSGVLAPKGISLMGECLKMDYLMMVIEHRKGERMYSKLL